MDETITFTMPYELYHELYATEVDTYEDNEVASKQHLAKAFLNATEQKTGRLFELDEDTFVYLVNQVFLGNMEMWSTWRNEEGEIFLAQAKGILNEFNLYYPF